MADTRKTKVLIIGSGPAGYTAGVYASRAMLEPILVQGIEPRHHHLRRLFQAPVCVPIRQRHSV